MGKYGEGSIRKRNGIYWVDFRLNGKRYQETTGSRYEHEAISYLTNRIIELKQSKLSPITVNMLLDDLEVDYRLGKKMDTTRVPYRIKHLREVFGDMPADQLTSSIITAYIQRRMKSGISGSTINRDLGLIRRAYSIAREAARINTAPRIPRLPERTVRTGFFTSGEVDRLCGYLPVYLQDFTRFAFITGWRKSEIRDLRWENVDLKRNEIRIWESKNGEGRVITINNTIREILDRQLTSRNIPWVFHYRFLKIGDFKKSWRTATIRANLIGRTFHDLRRSAIREMTNRGIHRQIAKKITGHKTDSIFNRYHIVTDDDINDAMRRLDNES